MAAEVVHEAVLEAAAVVVEAAVHEAALRRECDVEEWDDELYRSGTAACRAAEGAYWRALDGDDDVPGEEEDRVKRWNSRLDTITAMIGLDFRAAMACDDEDHDEDPAAHAAPSDDARA